MAEQVLAPAAEATDQSDSVPQVHLEALAAAGLFRPCPREVYEVLAGACGVTFFTWVQHHAPVRLLTASPNTALRDRWLPRLCAGGDAVLGGVAFAHLRRPGPPAVAARRIDGGWRLDGEAPWVTSWGLARVFAVAARTGDDGDDGDDGVVFAVVRGEAGPGLLPSDPLRLLAMQASRTVRLRFDGLRVPDSDVIVEQSFADWQARDRVATAKPNPAAFGLAATCTRLLAEVDPARADDLEAERLDCRAQSYGADPSDVERHVRLRAWSLELAQRAAFALVVATGGRAMPLVHPAQRLLREAAFYAIQAQTGPLREATLDRLTR